VAQGRGRQVNTGLDVARRRAFVPRLHHETQDGESDRMAEGTELLGVQVELRRHDLASNKLELVTQALSSTILEVTPSSWKAASF
jgi:hypothetical protein